ncbi:hypothetical protein IGB42_04060 [Andreprevotia sp. IGB-42]|nr:hypothetical protein IGB42_04060 [Andreprevotia sp. IGB-42]
MNSVFSRASFVLLLATMTAGATAADMDPEAFIKKYGHQYSHIDDDGKSGIYGRNEQRPAARLEEMEKNITRLPNPPIAQEVCGLLRRPIESGLKKKFGNALAIKTTATGIDGNIVLCAFPYTWNNETKKQVLYAKKTSAGTYLLLLVE